MMMTIMWFSFSVSDLQWTPTHRIITTEILDKSHGVVHCVVSEKRWKQIKRGPLPGNITSLHRKLWVRLQWCRGVTCGKRKRRGEKNIDLGLIISYDLSLDSVTPSTISLVASSSSAASRCQAGSGAVEYVGVKKSEGVKISRMIQSGRWVEGWS